MVKILFFLRKFLIKDSLLLWLLKPIIYPIYRIILLLYGASIPLNTKFNGTPYFPHGLYGIFISGDAVIGRKTTIFQHVTIGSITTKKSKRPGAPIIGDNVFIGVGAKIIGGIEIGNDAKIGANCVVVDDVPKNATVIPAKNRLIQKQTNLS